MAGDGKSVFAKVRTLTLGFRISVRAQLVLALSSFAAGFVVYAGSGDPRLIFFAPFLFIAVNLLLRITVFCMRTSGRDIEI
jgi:hypothetical protein